MTERFTFEFDNYNGRLFDNNYQTFYHIEDSEENIELLCNRLNELHEENLALKRDKTNLHRTMSKDRVRYNQFKDNVFCCIDKKIKLFQDCCMSNEVKILEDLKKEMNI